VPHKPGTIAQLGTPGPVAAADLAGAAGLPRATSSLLNTSFPTCTTWMNEIYQGNVGLIEWMKL
jgi:hypothetical protein